LHADAARPLDHGPQISGAASKVEVPLGIHGCGLDASDSDRIHEAAIVSRRFAEVHGNIVAPSGIMLLAVIAGKMPVEPQKMLTLRVGVQYGPRPHGQCRADPDAA